MWGPTDVRAATAGLEVQRTTRSQTNECHDTCKADLSYYFNDRNGPHNALGISGLEHRDRVFSPDELNNYRAASIIPNSQISPAVLTGNVESSHRIAPPPRNPRRLLHSPQYPREENWLPEALCIYHEPEDIVGSEVIVTGEGGESCSSSSSIFTLASTLAGGRHQPLEQISPPSSPEINTLKKGSEGEVSPIEDDAESQQRQFLNDRRPQLQPYHALPTDVPPNEHYDHRRTPTDPVSQTASHSSLPRSHRMRFSSLGDGSSSSLGQRMRFLGKNKSGPSDSPPQPALQADPRFGVAPHSTAIKIPRKSSKRATRTVSSLLISSPLSPINSSSEVESPTSKIPGSDHHHLPSKLPRKPLSVATPPPKRQSSAPTSNPAHALPTPPHEQYAASFNAAAPAMTAYSPFTSHNTSNSTNTIPRKSMPAHRPPPTNYPNPLRSSPVIFDHPQRGSELVVVSPPQLEPERSKLDEAWTQPPSRFSVTTYATSGPGTPHQATEEQMPQTLPQLPSRFSVTTFATSNPGTPPQTMEEQMPQTPQPPSRFSVTTFATTNVGTPRQPMEEQFPPRGTSANIRESPPATPEHVGTSDSIIVPKQRGLVAHPIAADDEASLGIHSPQVYSSHTGAANSSVSDHNRSNSVMLTSKPLPPAPPELSSSDDRISQLNALIAGLAHRRANINKSIKQMTELMPKDNLLASQAVLQKREMEKQKVEGLKQELAEIQREEHDLGLKLHRAYKRQDKNAEYEPTTLWVRRITT